jgi:predicted naringenin-chalcone synthase
MQSFITAIGTAVPQYKIDQKHAAHWMQHVLKLTDRETKLLKSLYDASGIESRYSVIEDFTSENNFRFFPESADLEPFPTTSQRMEVYRKNALPLAVEAIYNCLEKCLVAKENITHLIVVSCTGMYAPGLDIELIQNLGLQTTTERTCIQFMGCYAAFNGLKTADNICRSTPGANVLVLCIELCTIHFQEFKSRDHFVSNALFADGAAAVMVQSQTQKGSVNLELEAFHCDLALTSKQEMAWHIADHGFEMTLSSYVPQVIKSGIKQLTQNLLQKLNADLKEIHHFAIHPGGRKILEVCQEELGLNMDDLACSYEVLQNYGNMSSATVLFVLNELFKGLPKNASDERILSFAFGPGLTMESMILKANYYA